MSVYTNTTFVGHYPIGTAAVVIAPDKKTAAKLLNDKLYVIGLPASVTEDDMEELPMGEHSVIILSDGDY